MKRVFALAVVLFFLLVGSAQAFTVNDAVVRIRWDLYVTGWTNVKADQGILTGRFQCNAYDGPCDVQYRARWSANAGQSPTRCNGWAYVWTDDAQTTWRWPNGWLLDVTSQSWMGCA